MFAQEFVANQPVEKKDLKVPIAKYQSVLILAIFLFTMLAAAIHHHADLETRADCALCKFSQDLSGGNKTTPFVISTPEFLIETTYFVLGSLVHFNHLPASSQNLRSPPSTPR